MNKDKKLWYMPQSNPKEQEEEILRNQNILKHVQIIQIQIQIQIQHYF